MVWCSYCGKDQVAERDDIVGFTCCTGCGRVLADDAYSKEVTFSKGVDGSSQAEGNFIRSGQTSMLRIAGAQGRVLGFQSDSHEKTLNKGKLEIQEIAERLSIQPRVDIVDAAHRFYTIAVERNFTRGRPTARVAGACLYIVCRQENRPYMLIDFSDSLQTNVYVLGAVFLQLCQLLRLEQHPIMQRPVDPSLYIHRFADRLQFGKEMHAVANSALRLVASMKRDWMQTGRRPSGVCGAALFIAAHLHGFERSKADVVSVVHICEATLKKRLVEFEQTESGNLTAEEFDSKAKEIDAGIGIGLASTQIEGKRTVELLCEHKGMGAVHHAHGLCRGCYDEFVKVSGGIQGGSHPPSFERARKKRAEEAQREAAQNVSVAEGGYDDLTTLKTYQRGRPRRQERGEVLRSEGRSIITPLAHVSPPTQKRIRFKEVAWSWAEGSEVEQDVQVEKGNAAESFSDAATNIASLIDVALPLLEKKQYGIRSDMVRAGELCCSTGGSDAEGDDARDIGGRLEAAPIQDGAGVINEEDSESLSDIDDNEVNGYLHNEEEVRLKTIIWTEMNKEYLEEQEAKRAAAEANEKAKLAAFEAAATNSAIAVDLAAAAAAAIAKLKERKRKRVDEANRPPADSAADAACYMLASKKLSSKLNYSVLANLFNASNPETDILDDSTDTRQRQVISENDQRYHPFAGVAVEDLKLNSNVRVEAEKVEGEFADGNEDRKESDEDLVGHSTAMDEEYNDGSD